MRIRCRPASSGSLAVALEADRQVAYALAELILGGLLPSVPVQATGQRWLARQGLSPAPRYR